MCVYNIFPKGLSVAIVYCAWTHWEFCTLPTKDHYKFKINVLNSLRNSAYISNESVCTVPMVEEKKGTQAHVILSILLTKFRLLNKSGFRNR